MEEETSRLPKEVLQGRAGLGGNKSDEISISDGGLNFGVKGTFLLGKRTRGEARKEDLDFKSTFQQQMFH